MGSENKNGKVPLISKIAYGFGEERAASFGNSVSWRYHWCRWRRFALWGVLP